MLLSTSPLVASLTAKKGASLLSSSNIGRSTGIIVGSKHKGTGSLLSSKVVTKLSTSATSKKVAIEKPKTTLSKSKPTTKSTKSSSSKPKKSKVEKRPGEPTRPLSSYIQFSQDHRESVKKRGFTAKEITTELGRMWKDLKESEKAVYTKRYERQSCGGRRRDNMRVCGRVCSVALIVRSF